MEQNNVHSRRRKTISAALAVAMVLTMLLSGTLAYFYQSRAVNRIAGGNKSAIGHDDFVKLSVAADGDGTVKYEKNVYVENLGAEPVYVRVKLSEQFTLNNEIITKNETTGQMEAVTHIPAEEGTAGVGTGEHDLDSAEKQIHKYFHWDIGTAGDGHDQTKKFYLSANAKEFHDNQDSEGNPQTDKTPDIVIEDNVAKDNSNTTYTGEELGTYALSYARVITMKEYLAMTPDKREAFEGWVVDNSKVGDPINKSDGTSTTEEANGDGWAYWSQMLPGYKATGVLLNGVSVSPELENAQYTYDINVDFEIVDEVDEGLWLGTDMQPNNWESPLSQEQKDAVKVQTLGAKELLATAKAVAGEKYTPEVTALVAEIAAAQEGAKSSVSEGFYEAAISSAQKSSNSGEQRDAAEAYLKMAQRLDEMETTDRAYLDSIVLEVSETNGVYSIVQDTTVPNRINDMDPNIAAYLVKKYGHDMKLTGREAMSVTYIGLHPKYAPVWNGGWAYNFSNWNGLNKTNFKNLRNISLIGNFASSEGFSLDNFAVAEDDGYCPEMVQFEMGNYRGVPITLDFSNHPNLRYFLLEGNFKITNIDNLTKLRGIYTTGALSISDEDVKTLLQHNVATLNDFTAAASTVIYNAKTYEESNTKEAIADYSTLEKYLQNCLALKHIVLNGTGTVDLSMCPDLNSVSVTGVTIKVKDIDTLTEKTVKDGGKITDLAGNELTATP